MELFAFIPVRSCAPPCSIFGAMLNTGFWDDNVVLFSIGIYMQYRQNMRNANYNNIGDVL